MSYLIAISISLFVITISVELYLSKADYTISNLVPTQPHGIINSISVIGMSCFYHMNVFGIYTSMRDKSIKQFLIGAPIQSVVCASITITVGLISLFRFGDTLQENILLNLTTIPSTLSLILRFVFSVFVAS